jgi:hypothetical protein
LANPAANLELVKLVYIQMGVCLKALDALGFDVPAAHLDASINSLRKKVQDTALQSEADLTLEQDFGQIDVFIAQTVFSRQ